MLIRVRTVWLSSASLLLGLMLTAGCAGGDVTTPEATNTPAANSESSTDAWSADETAMPAEEPAADEPAVESAPAADEPAPPTVTDDAPAFPEVPKD